MTAGEIRSSRQVGLGDQRAGHKPAITVGVQETLLPGHAIRLPDVRTGRFSTVSEVGEALVAKGVVILGYGDTLKDLPSSCFEGSQTVGLAIVRPVDVGISHTERGIHTVQDYTTIDRFERTITEFGLGLCSPEAVLYLLLSDTRKHPLPVSNNGDIVIALMRPIDHSFLLASRFCFFRHSNRLFLDDERGYGYEKFDPSTPFLVSVRSHSTGRRDRQVIKT